MGRLLPSTPLSLYFVKAKFLLKFEAPVVIFTAAKQQHNKMTPTPTGSRRNNNDKREKKKVLWFVSVWALNE